MKIAIEKKQREEIKIVCSNPNMRYAYVIRKAIPNRLKIINKINAIFILLIRP